MSKNQGEKSGGSAPHRSKRSEAGSTQCKATTKAGTRCRAKAAIRGLCPLHADPKKAAELGRLGGRKNKRQAVDTDLADIKAPDTAADVKSLIGDAMVRVRAGSMDTKRATTLGYLGTTMLKAIEVADLEERLMKLEHGALPLTRTSSTPSEGSGKNTKEQELP